MGAAPQFNIASLLTDPEKLKQAAAQFSRLVQVFVPFVGKAVGERPTKKSAAAQQPEIDGDALVLAFALGALLGRYTRSDSASGRPNLESALRRDAWKIFGTASGLTLLFAVIWLSFIADPTAPDKLSKPLYGSLLPPKLEREFDKTFAGASLALVGRQARRILNKVRRTLPKGKLLPDAALEILELMTR